MNIKISTKLVFLITLILLSFAGVIAYTVSTLNQQKSDGLVINIAGRQRMLSQKFTKETLDVLAFDGSTQAVKKTRTLFEKSLIALMEGGETFKSLNLTGPVMIPKTTNPDILNQLQLTQKHWQALSASADSLLSNTEKDKSKALIEKLRKESLLTLKNMNKAVGMYANITEKKVTTMIRYEVIVFFVILFTGVTLSWFIIQSILSPLKALLQRAKDIAHGDLTQSSDHISASGELQEFKEAFIMMENNLKQTISRIKIKCTELRIATSELTQGNDSLSQRTESQAQVLEETSSSLTKVNQELKDNSQKALNVESVAKTSMDRSIKGESVMNDTVQTISKVDEKSKEIFGIIDLINEISFQTNLLALNASIEAARAGNAGSGFAVVAVEVRKLAQRSDEASKKISELLRSNSDKIKDGNALVKNAGETFQVILESMGHVSELISDINQSNSSQFRSIEEINQSLSQLNSNTQNNSALVEEYSASTMSILEQIKDVSESMNYFKTDTDDLNGAVSSKTMVVQEQKEQSQALSLIS